MSDSSESTHGQDSRPELPPNPRERLNELAALVRGVQDADPSEVPAGEFLQGIRQRLDEVGAGIEDVTERAYRLGLQEARLSRQYSLLERIADLLEEGALDDPVDAKPGNLSEALAMERGRPTEHLREQLAALIEQSRHTDLRDPER